jgi:prevent-host-death family protein
MRTYAVEEARAKLGDIVLDAAQGIPSLITYRGDPIAMVTSAPRSTTVADKDSATTTEVHHR